MRNIIVSGSVVVFEQDEYGQFLEIVNGFDLPSHTAGEIPSDLYKTAMDYLSNNYDDVKLEDIQKHDDCFSWSTLVDSNNEQDENGNYLADISVFIELVETQTTNLVEAA